MNGNSVSRYVLGVGALIILAGSLGIAAVSLRRRYLADLAGATARLAETVIGLALLTALLELLGTIGWFRLGPVVVASALIGLAGWRSLPPAPARPPASAASVASAAPAAPVRGRRPGRTVVSVGIIAVAAGALTAEWSAPTLKSYDVGIRTFDSLWYHLPWAAWFAQTGHITPLRFTDVEYLTPFYPATAELYHGLGIVLFGHDTLSPAINLAWLGLVLLAAYCVGRPYGLGALTLLGATLALATSMMTLSQAGSAANDIGGVFFLLAAVALLPGGRNGAAAGSLTLAAVAAGLAVGVKLTLLAPILALTLGAIRLAPRGRRRAVAVRWTGTAFLAGGFWYVRNLIAVGNPLPWLSLPGLAAPVHPLQQDTGFSVAHYLTDSHTWSAVFGPGLKGGLGPWWPAVLAATLVGPLLCLFGGGDRRRVLGLVALASLAAYLITPETAAGPRGDPAGFPFNLRYAAPALVLSLTILPLAPALASRRRRTLVAVALALVAVATAAQAQLWPARHTLGMVLVGAAVGLLVAAVALLGRRARLPARSARGARAPSRTARGARAPSRTLAALLGSGLVIAGAAAGYGWQRHYLRGRYQFNPGVSSLARVWAFFRNTHHVRVGIVGTFGGFFSYPLFGAADSNAVEYVAEHGPHGSFTPITSCRRWRTAVNAGHFRYVVTTPARDPWHPKPLHFSPEGAWTASDPAARLVYTHRAAGQPIAVFVLTGSLDPAGCRRR